MSHHTTMAWTLLPPNHHHPRNADDDNDNENENDRRQRMLHEWMNTTQQLATIVETQVRLLVCFFLCDLFCLMLATFIF
jgi:hypothetical protein